MAIRALAAAGKVVGARELLRNLTVRELKVRYKRSTLGFLWTLLNPLLMMAVFTVVLTKAGFGPKIPYPPLYFLSAYLPFAFFQASVVVGTSSIVGNAGLITKVYFPREVLPLSSVLSQFVHLMLGLGVLLVVELLFRSPVRLSLIMLPVALLLLAMFTTGVTLLFAATNTILRDIQEFLGVGMMILFYLTPVIYQKENIPASWRWLPNMNPLTHYVALFRAVFYERRMPSGAALGASAGAAVVMLMIGATVFARLSVRFAKDV